MDSSNFQDCKNQNPKPSSSKHGYKKRRLTQEQVNVLENSFTGDKKLEPELKQRLAFQLGLPPRQVAIWYQNKRARWKTWTLEAGYTAMRLALENALADKQRLEREVKRLQEELEMFRNHKEECCKVSEKAGQVVGFDDELYACLFDNRNVLNGSSSSCLFD